MMKNRPTRCLAATFFFAASAVLQADTVRPLQLPDLSKTEWGEVEKAFEFAYDDWDAGFTAHLATSDDPALRVMGIYMIALNEHAAANDEQARLPYLKEIRTLAENPGVHTETTWVASRICQGSCQSKRMNDILASSEPGNAAVIVLDLTRREAADPKTWLEQPETREQLLRLSSADRFDTHQQSLLNKLAMALEQYLNASPFPPMPHGAGTMEGAAAWLELLTHSSISLSFPSWSVSKACREGIEADDEEVSDACRKVAELMIASRNAPEQQVGRQIERHLDYPDADSETHRRWRWEAQRQTWASRCVMPFRADDNALLAALTPQDAYQWANDSLVAGGFAGGFRIAKRLYAQYPDAFVVSPQECRRFERLTPEQVGRIFHDGEFSVRWEQAFIRMEQLESAGELDTLDD